MNEHARRVMLLDSDPLAEAVMEARLWAYGDSNDKEIEALHVALELALDAAGVMVREPTEAEIAKFESEYH